MSSHENHPSRRSFLTTLAATTAGLAMVDLARAAKEAGKPLPNFVWIVTEDMGTQIGCYGDDYAITPHIDKLASEGARFTHCFSHAPVCAPARSGLITGMYPTTMGSHHMRSNLLSPPRCFTHDLIDAGYAVHFQSKMDFNFNPQGGWRTADLDQNWRNNPPQQPFFAYHNIFVSHEGQVRASEANYQKNTAKLTPDQRHDPAKAPLPPYYPDTPLVRKDVARYYDGVTAADYQVGEVLDAIDKQGLRDNTIVMFFGDHGWGMSRGKRWLYDSGIHVPFIIRWPGKIKPGTVRDDLVSFIDIGPTMLHVAGATLPDRMQGMPFLGDNIKPRKYVFSARDRMDETFDRIRSVRDNRWKYIRNFHPELPYSQHISYMDEMPTMKEWRRLNAEGKLEGPQKLWFAAQKPAEELYDCETDPHEINNLAASTDPVHVAKLAELRAALDQWIIDTKDLGAVPETDLIKRGLVEDRLSNEYKKRLEAHPVPGASNLPPNVRLDG